MNYLRRTIAKEAYKLKRRSAVSFKSEAIRYMNGEAGSSSKLISVVHVHTILLTYVLIFNYFVICNMHLLIYFQYVYICVT